MTAIAKACQDLSRTHSWCMSGTPVGSVVQQPLAHDANVVFVDDIG